MEKTKCSYLSIIVPMYNEKENVSLLVDNILQVLLNIGLEYELILVNDGSTDETWKSISHATKNNERVKGINLCRNYGQTTALMAGFYYASGDVIITMDGDLQNDPCDIPNLINQIDLGYDVVSGWRVDRQDDFLSRKIPSIAANKLISWISGVNLHDYGCTLKAYRRKIIKNIYLYGEMHRFVPIYAKWHGASVAELPVKHHPRTQGKSKYGIERIFKVILDLIVVKFLESHFTKPIYVFGGFGLLCTFFSFALLFIVIYLKLFYSVSMIQTPLPLLSVMTFITGVMCILMGIMAEILVRIYFESQKKTTYLVQDVINLTHQK